jgi:hypothetical protein
MNSDKIIVCCVGILLPSRFICIQEIPIWGRNYIMKIAWVLSQAKLNKEKNSVLLFDIYIQSSSPYVWPWRCTWPIVLANVKLNKTIKYINTSIKLENEYDLVEQTKYHFPQNKNIFLNDFPTYQMIVQTNRITYKDKKLQIPLRTPQRPQPVFDPIRVCVHFTFCYHKCTHLTHTHARTLYIYKWDT